jgi:hypothetical protein
MNAYNVRITRVDFPACSIDARTCRDAIAIATAAVYAFDPSQDVAHFFASIRKGRTSAVGWQDSLRIFSVNIEKARR